MFVIQRHDGKYVTVPGSHRSYSNKLQEARRYESRKAAQKDTCIENERVVEL